MKVRFKPYVKDILMKCHSQYTFALEDIKTITYFKQFIEYDYFIVEENAYRNNTHYKIKSPEKLNMFYLHKDHIENYGGFEFDDKLFEWEE